MDCDLGCGIRLEMVAVFSVTVCEPMPNSSSDLTAKLEAALLSQMSEIADQVCDAILVSGAPVLLESRDGLDGLGSAVTSLYSLSLPRASVFCRVMAAT
jgi:hypothetical protein